RTLILRALHSFPTRRSSDLGLLFLSVPNRHHHRCCSIREIREDICCNLLFPMLSCHRRKHKDLVCGSRSPVILRCLPLPGLPYLDRKSTRLNSSHVKISYAV